MTVRFSRDFLAVLCDDAILWSSVRRGPGGTLRQVALSCVGEQKAATVRGRVEFAEFALARTSDEPRRPPGDSSQEEVWLADGDQLFGDSLRIDRQGVEIQGAFGKRSLPWAGARGCWFRRDAAPPPAVAGVRVRLWLDSGLDSEPDELEGALKAMDEKQLTLINPWLGELQVSRERLHRLRPLP